MKRAFLIVIIVLILCNTGCSSPRKTKTYDNGLLTYYSMSDGSWMCDEISYKERLEIKGTINDNEVTYILLSNIGDITFKQAELNSGISSNSRDYFSPEEAIMVEIIVD